ncbi:MAG: NYN domain-containing protein [Nostoc sp. DedVER02]|uniref:NYN domain-containing protein n=1 Tax=unclassified Nostoc TaxID=2593658 RepID=UPI002AD32EB1|nr:MULTISPECIES: NYN domain-containing protein [unclassified Nostoc]MDZ7987928.1 NYN domain-containing protein [Nostoc sp. DedVER02]MDZ8114514.1 NYN domain-containing protein [Nostoc sp. DedVER01b]
MPYANQSSKKQASQQLPLVSIYWDYQNTKLSPSQVKSLLDLAQSKGCVISINVYYNSQREDQTAVKDDLGNLGFNCVNVPCPLKNSADNQLIADCLEEIHSNMSPDKIMLISGNGDFVKLVHNLQKLGKQAIILAQIGNVKQKLKELADEFYFLDDLSRLISDKNQPQIISVVPQINYNDAIDYLVEAINTLSSQDRSTVFGCIDQLMRQLCAKYQGCSSISTANGKKFKRFSQFIDAAIRDGKVQKQGKELFLVELDKLAA